MRKFKVETLLEKKLSIEDLQFDSKELSIAFISNLGKQRDCNVEHYKFPTSLEIFEENTSAGPSFITETVIVKIRAVEDVFNHYPVIDPMVANVFLGRVLKSVGSIDLQPSLYDLVFVPFFKLFPTRCIEGIENLLLALDLHIDIAPFAILSMIYKMSGILTLYGYALLPETVQIICSASFWLEVLEYVKSTVCNAKILVQSTNWMLTDLRLSLMQTISIPQIEAFLYSPNGKTSLSIICFGWSALFISGHFGTGFINTITFLFPISKLSLFMKQLLYGQKACNPGYIIGSSAAVAIGTFLNDVMSACTGFNDGFKSGLSIKNH